MRRTVNADELKQAVSPAEFFRAELTGFAPARNSGWIDGGLCPFHDDRRPGSFKVNLDTGAFKCFSCDASGGDIIDFVMVRDGLVFRQAMEYLAHEWGVRRW